MSNLLPAKRQRVWLVDPRGSAIEKAAPPKQLTSGQRHYMYRLGLLAVDKFLKERGFTPNSSDSTTVFSYEKKSPDRLMVWIDLKLAEPGNIAYVTSYAGYKYSTEKVKAKVITAKDILGCDKLIQLNISTQDGDGTRKPIFIPLPPNLDNPAQHVLRNVLGMLSMACESIPRMREAFTREEVKAAQEQEIDVSAMPLLPE